MPYEFSLGGALLPGVLLWFTLMLGVLWGLDAVAGRYGLYRYVWHPPLFRIALFICLFCGFGLLLF